MTNAGTAKKWLLDYYKGDESCVAKHFAVRVPQVGFSFMFSDLALTFPQTKALSTNAAAVSAFGIDTNNMVSRSQPQHVIVISNVGLVWLLGLGRRTVLTLECHRNSDRTESGLRCVDGNARWSPRDGPAFLER